MKGQSTASKRTGTNARPSVRPEKLGRRGKTAATTDNNSRDSATSSDPFNQRSGVVISNAANEFKHAFAKSIVDEARVEGRRFGKQFVQWSKRFAVSATTMAASLVAGSFGFHFPEMFDGAAPFEIFICTMTSLAVGDVFARRTDAPSD